MYFCTTDDGTDVCENHKELTTADRREDYSIPSGGLECDSDLESGWYRFTGEAGTQMAHTCMSTGLTACSALGSGWLVDSYPTVDEGIVHRGVCFRTPGSCCAHAVTIRVRNCGPFMVYHLDKTKSCPYRYCSTVRPEKPVDLTNPTSKYTRFFLYNNQ